MASRRHLVCQGVFLKPEEDQDGVFAREYEEIDARDLEAIYLRYVDNRFDSTYWKVTG